MATRAAERGADFEPKPSGEQTRNYFIDNHSGVQLGRSVAQKFIMDIMGTTRQKSAYNLGSQAGAEIWDRCL